MQVYVIVPKFDQPNQEISDKYYGSTNLPDILDRLFQHYYSYKFYLKTGKHYCRSFFLFEKYGFDNLLIIDVEKCDNRNECYLREAYYIKNSPCINHNIPLRTNQQWRLDNIINYKRYQKIYQEGYRARQKEIKQLMNA
jgi:hypothetical protein